jgi:hypothetical protein
MAGSFDDQERFNRPFMKKSMISVYVHGNEASFSGAEELTARAISARAQCACLLSLKMGSIN